MVSLRPRTARPALALLTALLVASMLAAMTTTAADARAARVARVSSVTVTKPTAADWSAQRVRLHWRAVAGATSYQYRWSPATTMRGASAPVTTTRRQAAVQPLSRASSWYFQVRAQKGSRHGAWSAVRSTRFSNKWPAAPTTRLSTSAGRVTVSWARVPYASRYRVTWSSAPFGKRIVASSGWLPESALSATLPIASDATSDATMTAPAYGNKVYVQVEANDQFKTDEVATHQTPWDGIYPQAPAAPSGAAVRFGTYNVLLGSNQQDAKNGDAAPWSTRYPVMAATIAARKLSVVALQEIGLDSNGSSGADDVAHALGGGWKVADPGDRLSDGRILYDSAAFRLLGSGRLNDYGSVQNYAKDNELSVPWARLQPTGGGTPFLVASIHFAMPGSYAASQYNAASGADADQVVKALAALQSRAGTSDPVVVAGDFTSSNSSFTDQTTGQTQLVRHGFSDAIAARSRGSYTDWTTVLNPVTLTERAPQAHGIGGRADGIYVAGGIGSASYDQAPNVRDRTGVRVSDHNLVYAQLQLP
ncbi:MAG: hypothetical protein ACTHNS_04560 [Marmoricola sp.]